MKSKLKSILAYLIIPFAAFQLGCAAIKPSNPVTTPNKPVIVQQKEDIADWTIMCYFNGDNNLADSMLEIIDHLEKEGSSDKVNVLILYDGHDNMKHYPRWNGTKLLYLQKDEEIGKINSKIINKFEGELDMGSPETLEELVKYSIKNYPSKKKMLIFFSHGKGTAGGFIDNDKNKKRISLSPDETSKSGLTVEEAHLAIKSALDSENKGEKLDAIIMFSCLTNMLGLNYSFKDITKLLIGSEDEIWYIEKDRNQIGIDGIQIDAIIKKLKHDPHENKEGLTKFIIDSSIDPYKQPLVTPEGETYYEGGLAGIDSEKIDSFMPYFHKFSDTLKKRLENPETKKNTVHTLFKATTKSRKYCSVSYHDLYDFLEQIEENSGDLELKESISKLRNFLKDELIIYEKHQYHKPDRSHGLSIYFIDPVTVEKFYQEYQDYYKKSELARDTSWDEVIELFRKGVKELRLK